MSFDPKQYEKSLPREGVIFKRCENCRKLRFKWLVKKQEIYVKQINQVVTGKKAICGGCRKVVEKAIKERNV